MLTAFLLLAEEGKGGGGLDPLTQMLIPMVAIFALFYFLIILPTRRQEKRQREDLFTKLKKNDEVLTNAGIIGVVFNIKDDEVVLKIDDNAKLRVLKSTLVRIINPKDAPATPADASQNVKAGTPTTK